MRRCLFLTFAVALSASAHSATLIADNGSPFTYSVHANHAGAGTSLSLLGENNPNASLPIIFSSLSSLNVGNGNGVATISGPFARLTISPGSNYGFTALQFKLDPSSKSKHLEFDATVSFLGGGSQTFTDFMFDPNNKFDLTATGKQVITSIVFSNLEVIGIPTNLNFADMKQVSFNAVRISTVPEPTSWTMMILGFGIAGALMRRRQRAANLGAVSA